MFLSEQAKLIASDGVTWDYFGTTVCVSGDTVVVGLAHGPAVGGVVVGIGNGPDLLLPRSVAARFGVPQALDWRGSYFTTDQLVGDLDLDGDDDVVTLRAATLPGLLMGQLPQLTQNSITQIGRSASLFLSLPTRTSVGLVGLWITPIRFPIPGLGILRISSPIQILSLGPNQTSANFLIPIPKSLAPFPLPAQLFLVDRGGLKLGNLDILQFTRH